MPFDPEAYGSWAGGGNGSNVVVNFLNGLGLSGDMSTGIRFLRPRRLQWTELDALHTDAIGRRIAELPAHEATREGYQVRAREQIECDRQVDAQQPRERILRDQHAELRGIQADVRHRVHLTATLVVLDVTPRRA